MEIRQMECVCLLSRQREACCDGKQFYVTSNKTWNTPQDVCCHKDEAARKTDVIPFHLRATTFLAGGNRNPQEPGITPTRPLRYIKSSHEQLLLVFRRFTVRVSIVLGLHIIFRKAGIVQQTRARQRLSIFFFSSLNL
jgi:hypothetical protein